MNSKISFLAACLFLLILNLADYANQIYEGSNLGVFPTSLKELKKEHTGVSVYKTDDERPIFNPIYVNKKIAFRHLMLSHSQCKIFSRI